VFTPGTTKNLVIKHNGQTLFDRKGGDGYLDGNSSVKFIEKLRKAVTN